jgi:hypothetical protein
MHGITHVYALGAGLATATFLLVLFAPNFELNDDISPQTT